MKVGCAGTPEFARTALAAVLDAGHEVPLVLTQPDRPAGRGLKPQASPVKVLAQARGLALAQPRSLRLDGKWPDDAAAARVALQAAGLDVLVVAAYGLILPQWVLTLPRHGAVNIHGSLLPRWRGAAPVQRAIEAGDAETGVTIMQMDAGLDTGAMLLAEATPLAADDTAASVTARLAGLGARLLLQVLARLAQGPLTAVAQPEAGVTYARKVDKAEAAIAWQQPAAVIERRLRAFDPAPGCSTELAGHAAKVWRGAVVAGSGAAGEVQIGADGSLRVACGEDVLEIVEIQPAGGRRIAGREFARRLRAAGR
jgi:methionyl-tRNA formyltransferase